MDRAAIRTGELLSPGANGWLPRRRAVTRPSSSGAYDGARAGSCSASSRRPWPGGVDSVLGRQPVGVSMMSPRRRSRCSRVAPSTASRECDSSATSTGRYSAQDPLPAPPRTPNAGPSGMIGVSDWQSGAGASVLYGDGVGVRLPSHVNVDNCVGRIVDVHRCLLVPFAVARRAPHGSPPDCGDRRSASAPLARRGGWSSEEDVARGPAFQTPVLCLLIPAGDTVRPGIQPELRWVGRGTAGVPGGAGPFRCRHERSNAEPGSRLVCSALEP
jgi:hypothetical protein